MNLFEHQQCQRITKGTPAMDAAQINQYLPTIPGWHNNNNLSIVRDFTFSDYYQTMAFVNAVAFIAHQCDHHPDLEVSYNHCKVTYTTHTIKGLSLNDFICAFRINQLVASGK